MPQPTVMIHETKFPTGTSFATREMLVNRDLVSIQNTLRSRGFYMLGSEITSKTDTKAVIKITYQ